MPEYTATASVPLQATFALQGNSDYRGSFGHPGGQSRTLLHSSSTIHGSPSTWPGASEPGQKRRFPPTFDTCHNPAKRLQAAPAVPSFNSGIHLWRRPQALGVAQPRAKKARVHNQLGLTPNQDQDSSSSDEDEEIKLAACGSTTTIQIEHRGRTATLQTAADIAAWIAERKKRFPTQAKVEAAKKEAEEGKRKWIEEKRASEAAARAGRLARGQIERAQRELRCEMEGGRRKKLEGKRLHKTKGEKTLREGDILEDTVTRAKVKAELLRRKALKLEQRAAKAAAVMQKTKETRQNFEDESGHASGLIVDHGDLRDPDPAVVPVKDEQQQQQNQQHDVLLEEIDGPCSEDLNELDHVPVFLATEDAAEKSPAPTELTCGSSVSVSDSSTDSDSDMDLTSSAGSSSSDPGSNTSSDPVTSKCMASDRIAALPRHQNLCQRLLKTGHCRFGDRCRDSHTIPGGSNPRRRQKREKIGTLPGPRKGLWQVMVDKELEQEREHGMLEEEQS